MNNFFTCISTLSFTLVFSNALIAATISVHYSGTSEKNDYMGNAVAIKPSIDSRKADGMVVGVKGEDGSGAIMYYDTEDSDPVYVKYNGNQGDGFGSAIAVGHLNDDFYEDLAVGVPNADFSSYKDAGEVYIFYGKRDGSGPDWHNPEILRDSSHYIKSGAKFGFSLAAGAIVDRGFRGGELVVGAPYSDVNGQQQAGTVKVFWRKTARDANGLPSRWKRKTIHQGVTGIAGSPEAYDRFGWSLDVDSTHNTIIIGVPYEDIGDVGNAGMVQIVKLNKSSKITDSQHFHQNQPSSMHGSPEHGDLFGYSVAIDDSGFLVGVPREDVRYNGNDVRDAGVAHLVEFNSGKLTASSVKLLTQASDLFGNAPEAGDYFGYALDLSWHTSCSNTQTPACGASTLNIAIGAPGENNGKGIVQYYDRWNNEKLQFTQGRVGGIREDGDRFGNAVHLHGRRIIIGAPNEEFREQSRAGTAHLVKLERDYFDYRVLTQ